MPVKGDFGKLAGWEALLENADALLSPTSALLAETTVDQIAQGFRAGKDPYGQKWPPKKKSDGRKVLHGKTSRLRRGWHPVKTGPKEFEVAPSVDYAAPHQSPKTGRGGGLKRPRRMMVPTASKGLPDAWADQYTDVTDAAFAEWFKTTVAKGSVRIGGGGGGGRLSIIARQIVGAKRRFSLQGIIRRATRQGDDEK